MTSLLQAPARADADPRRPRPLSLVATLGGALAAAIPLLVCVCVGVIGWFLSDAGVHGTPRDGLRTGGLAWLMGHGSGVTVRGALVSVVPLGLTLVSAWSVWRVGHRVGDLVSGHGPDADRISDGERDWTVPAAVLMFFAGYVVVAVTVVSLSAGADAALSTPRVVGWTLLLSLLVAAPAISIGSGRAAIWAALVPSVLRGALAACLGVLGAFLLAASGILLLGLALGLGEAATMMSRLHLHPGEAVLYSVVNVAFLPNAVVFSGAWLLGPGFAVGAGTLVSPALVVLGPLPLFPLLAALPGNQETSSLTAAAVALPPLVAALGAAAAQRRHPTLRWDEAALRGCGGGILAGVLVGLAATIAGGAVGPGRMRLVGPAPFDVLVHAITAFGLGALVGALAMTWWHRRRHAAP